ncbi:MAG: FAD-dependent oxidoreductase [Candidatus Gastranaerophilales bacterium]|nr:FAD-dependent oxidoreductase [Candidatus Gastranaerophilales bacterium]
MEREVVDVVVVGAGPAGVAAAITLAKSGKEVVVLERGDYPGSKNVFGGAIYTKPTAEIFPEFWKSAPVERYNVEHRFALLGDNDGTVVGYRNEEHAQEGHYNSFTVVRAKWDRWCAEQAEKAGAFIVPQTLVTELIKENGKVVGVKTEQEEFYARIVIVADGVNSLLAKDAGFHPELKPEAVALGVKEVIKLPKEKIQDRFNLEGDSGVIYTVIGGPMQNMLGLGFIYTNIDSVVVGLGVSLSEFQHKTIKPYELLNQFKEHPVIRPLIAGGELLEYSAHLIPEGGYNSMPPLYSDGVMIAGDAAMLVNNIHWEGTNLALMSGKYAAEAAIKALETDEFSANSLSVYQKKLEESFVMKDLKSYKDVMKFAEKNSNILMGYYPNKVNEFFNQFISVDGIPKKDKYRSFIGNALKERSIPKMIGDFIKFAKVGGGVLLK